MSAKLRNPIFRRLRDASLLACGLVFIAVSAAGAATISGRIAGRTPILDGLSVTATQIQTGRQWAAVPDNDGSFTIGPDVPVGDAVIVLSVPGLVEPLDSRLVRVTGTGVSGIVLSSGTADRAPDTYTFHFYRGEYYNNKPTELLADLVHVTAPATTPNINFGLSEGGGSISGRVTNEAGTTGLADIMVFVIGLSTGVLSFDKTDATGNYQVTGISADSFWVSANLFLPEENDYVGEFYNNATGFLDIDAVIVTEGNNTPNINFGLALGGTIMGRVTAESGGAGIGFADVTAQIRAPDFRSKSVTTDADGFYTIRGLPASSQYVVYADADGYVSEYYNNKPDEASADNVVVTSGGSTPNINLALTTGARIEGTVLKEGTGEPLANMAVLAEATAGSFTASDYTDETGHYSINSLPAGSYFVSVPEIGKYWNNVTDQSSATAVTVTAGQVVTGINFTGVPGATGCELPAEMAARITGHVTNQAAAAVAGVTVTAYMDFGLGNPFAIAHTETDVNGDYALECLSEGTYFVKATPDGTNLLPEWYNNADSLAVATPVAPNAGATASNINFTLGTGGAISGRVTIEGTTTPLQYVTVSAKNVATSEEFVSFTDASGNYTINQGAEGGLRTGDYKVWVDPYSTSILGLVPVVLTRFEAYEVPEGIAVEWGVEGDDVAGYHVYRSNNIDAEPVRLTEQPLQGDEFRYLDTTADMGDQSYWIGIIDRGGLEERFGPVTARRGDLPILTRLYGPRPNPVQSSSEIGFSLARPGRVTLRIHDLAGRLVRTLVDQELPAGASKVLWDTRSDGGRPAPSGMYYVRLAAGGVVSTEKVIVTR